MNFFKIPLPRFPISAGFFLMAALTPSGAAEESTVLSGAGWVQYGQIVHSTDTTFGKDFNGQALYNSGAQLELKAKVSDKVDAVAGVGVFYGHNLAGPISSNGGYAPSFTAPYVAEAHITYNFIKEEDSKLFLRGGLFPYDYNPEVQNLGLYLLRGPLYPGVLISGFETKSVLPIASFLGMQLHHQSGAFEQDVIINSELDYFPYFDLSPAYIATYRFGDAFRLGGGVNFYHLISINDSLTSGKWNRQYSTFVDTTGGKTDSTLIGFSGIKLMVNGTLDPKAFMKDKGRFGAEDLKIYSEVALFGLNNSTPYKKLYGDYLHRMPMMAGFNIPVLGILDRLALEVEWYGSPISDDLDGFIHTAGSHQNPLPLKNSNGTYPSMQRDNWKWSLYGSKVIQNHVKISAQVANDHFRPGVYSGDGDNNAPTSEALMVTPKDWYTMLKVAYFF